MMQYSVTIPALQALVEDTAGISPGSIGYPADMALQHLYQSNRFAETVLLDLQQQDFDITRLTEQVLVELLDTEHTVSPVRLQASHDNLLVSGDEGIVFLCFYSLMKQLINLNIRQDILLAISAGATTAVTEIKQSQSLVGVMNRVTPAYINQVLTTWQNIFRAMKGDIAFINIPANSIFITLPLASTG